jgi:hypothetical protein
MASCVICTQPVDDDGVIFDVDREAVGFVENPGETRVDLPLG